MSARGIVPMKPHCRNCGIQVPRLERCPKCGRRNWALFDFAAWFRR